MEEPGAHGGALVDRLPGILAEVLAEGAPRTPNDCKATKVITAELEITASGEIGDAWVWTERRVNYDALSLRG